MTFLDYHLEITEERDLPIMLDSRWRYVFSTSIDGVEFRCDTPKRSVFRGDITLNGVSQIAYQMVQSGMPDGTFHVRQARYGMASSLPPEHRCYYEGSFGPTSKLALYHQMPHIEHNWQSYRFDVNTRKCVLTSVLIGELREWLKDGYEGFLDYATSYHSWDDMSYALGRNMPRCRSDIVRRRKRHYYVHLLDEGAAVSFMLRWRGDGSMLGKAIDWTKSSKCD